MACSSYFHYQNVSDFIPCVYHHRHQREQETSVTLEQDLEPVTIHKSEKQQVLIMTIPQLTENYLGGLSGRE